MYHTVEFNVFKENLNDIVFDSLRKQHLQQNTVEKPPEKFPEPIPKPSMKSWENSADYRADRDDK